MPERPTPVAAWSKAWVCIHSFVGLGLNPARGMDIYHLRLLCVVRQGSLRRADHSSRGVLLSVLCLR